MGAENKKRGRWAHLDDFHRTASGEYIYVGPLYVCREGDAAWRRSRRILGLLAAVMAAAVVAGGSVRAPGTGHCAYVLLPYVLSLLSVMSLLWGFIRLAGGKTPLRGYVYDATVPQFPLRTALALLGGAAAIVGELVYVLRSGTGGMIAGMVLFFAAEVIVAAGAILWRRQMGKIHWDRQEDENLSAT